MLTIIIECAGIAICFLASRKKFNALFDFSLCSLLYAFAFSLLYTAFIFIIVETALGRETLSEFIFGISLESFILVLIYPLVIAVSEEYVFRYFLDSKIGITAGTMIFTLAHWRPIFPTPMFLLVFIFGITQAYLYKKSGGLTAPILAHLAATYALLWLFV